MDCKTYVSFKIYIELIVLQLWIAKLMFISNSVISVRYKISIWHKKDNKSGSTTIYFQVPVDHANICVFTFCESRWPRTFPVNCVKNYVERIWSCSKIDKFPYIESSLCQNNCPQVLYHTFLLLIQNRKYKDYVYREMLVQEYLKN